MNVVDEKPKIFSIKFRNVTGKV